jgi:predicted ATP-grasp superfamily ATP-dependent carboligase
MAGRSESNEVEIITVKELDIKEPLVICGFVGAGLVGVIAAEHLIAQLKMEEVAYVRTEYLLQPRYLLARN